MPTKVKTTGSKVEVYHGTAKHTAGGLKKGDLMKNKHGKVVSKAKHDAGMRSGKANLGSYLQPSKGGQVSQVRRVTRSQKGSGFIGDIADGVKGVASIFGLGLPTAATAAYSSRGGRLRR